VQALEDEISEENFGSLSGIARFVGGRSCFAQVTMSPMATGAAVRWGAVAGRTIYFGHQSVGRDLIAGIKRLNHDGAIGLSLIQTEDPTSLTGPAFVHFLAGSNRDYASKNAALLRLLKTRKQADEAIVLLKYCYVDIGGDLDPDTLFSAYCEMMETIQSSIPTSPSCTRPFL